ncbi:MAG: hypothetical protein Q8M88_11900 [Phenylobacterium sp.]|uniref:hypothetical protein n=1 Tax=Phenylobacterium sp. TaxID=1871053 RepID=UPI002736442F|nr:hypothetical protein [Phenylobacterium sp.]MDP3175124.1 hypothetical protein [Phenylobacterium sp.]
MAVQAWSKSFRSARALRIALAVTWGVFALGGAKLFWDMTWGERDNPTALARHSLELAKGASSPAKLAEAERLTRKELQFGPYRVDAWCRLAFIQRRRAGRLDNAAIQSMRRAYEVAPFSTEVFLWRTEFLFDNWSQAPDDLKQRALAETRAFYAMWRNRQAVELMAARVEDPAGRLAIELVLLSAPMPKVG